MSNLSGSSAASGSLIARNYTSFRGVDFSSRKDEVSAYRSPDALNVWKNYKNSSGNCIETRPDIDLVKTYENTIYGLYFYNGNMRVHSGTKLYKNDISRQFSLDKPSGNLFRYKIHKYLLLSLPFSYTIP